MSIGFLFGGKPQYHADADNGWEPFSNSAISGDWDLGEWDDVVRDARSMGVSVEHNGEAVLMSRGKSHGRFLNTRGGVAMARQFLEGVA